MKQLSYLVIFLAFTLGGCTDRMTEPAGESETLTSSPVLISENTTNVIFWNQRRALAWSDFQGTPDPSSPHLALSWVGSTDIESLNGSPDGTITIVGAETIFDPSRSWVTPAAPTDALLHHEQGHFDLEEAVTRDFRTAIKRAAAKTQSGPKLQRTIAGLIARFTKRGDGLHDRYDKDTKHGNDAAAQGRWDKRIERMLNEPDVFRDDFDGSSLAEGWRWVRENPAAWSLTGGTLRIEMERGDLWQNWTNNCRNLLLTTAPIDDTYIIETHVEATLVANINQALIVLYGDDDNYVRFGLIRCCGGGLFLNHVHEIHAATQPQAHTAYGSGDVFLRILKSGGSTTLQYSPDGTSWQTHSTVSGLGFAVSSVGLVAFDGSEPPSSSVARYDYFEVRRGTE